MSPSANSLELLIHAQGHLLEARAILARSSAIHDEDALVRINEVVRAIVTTTEGHFDNVASCAREVSWIVRDMAHTGSHDRSFASVRLNEELTALEAGIRRAVSDAQEEDVDVGR
jgi:hypothetical protein